jgi:hypothetical protein
LRLTVALPAKNKKPSSNFLRISELPLREAAKNCAIRATPPESAEAALLHVTRTGLLVHRSRERSVNRHETRNCLPTRT